ncbi:hypothetical protein OEV82_08790 [Caldibacillus thermolactis]|jgi:L-cystine uptake protein TcyP (sodium:dicarboxylate symporter family)|uniref:Holin n=1 Tax=Pallidibacillus thermolactis TaxID=251051 RepID=A0ABT2WGK2_9BACI|nr:hypothetical protein [Pallidibacillus thermolactis]MCU9594552.1 hypothetical protein [Pallidibacillus thermolactis]MCU9602080.1 hypothetical protein [Pallidibacillus thermolactis subsp. kokeshiiformis]MED1673935.1 hypothetical protein [Pallidibacillus thermolactis subsp. kokeshiiformis]
MFEIYDVAIIPLIAGITEIFKKIGLPAKYSPIVAIFLGIIITLVYVDVTPKEGVLVGIMLGLSASGFYSGTKNLVEKRSKIE